MGAKPENSGYFASGQAWTLPDACAITLDVYPPNSAEWRADRCSTPYTNHALNLVQTDLEYEVTRVKFSILGRDLNPMGRGDGYYYMCGDYYIAAAKPFFLGQNARGYGSSINNSPDTPHELANDPCAQAIIEKAEGMNQVTIQEICEGCWPKVPSWHPAWPCEFAKLLCCLFTFGALHDVFGLSNECDYKRCTAGYPWRACCYVCGHCIGQSEEEQAKCPCDRCGIYCAPCKCPPSSQKSTSDSTAGIAVDLRAIQAVGTLKVYGLSRVPGIQTLRNVFKLDKDEGEGGPPLERDMGWHWGFCPRCPPGYEVEVRESKYLGLYKHCFCVLKSKFRAAAGMYCAGFCRDSVNLAEHCDHINKDFSNIFDIAWKTQVCYGLCLDTCMDLVAKIGMPIREPYSSVFNDAVDECCCISSWEPDFGFSTP